MKGQDVVVIGGGPAGTAAALTLARYSSLETILVERGDFSDIRIGETIGPGANSLLKYLGVADHVFEGAHRAALSVAAAWGSQEIFTQDFLFSGRGEGWHLDRNRFDAMLATAAREAGATVHTGTTVRKVATTNDGLWQLALESSDGAPATLNARFLIDASGRTAIVARGLGSEPAPIDRLVGVVGNVGFDSTSREDGVSTLVESVPQGWWYSTWVPGGNLAVALMSDADLLRPIEAQSISGWIRLLSEAPLTRKRVVGGRRPPRLYTRSATSHLLCPAGGEGWLSAGDALSAFDPLSSMGVGHALASGASAGRAAEASLRGDLGPTLEYTANSTKHFTEFLEIRSRYYAMEKRWPHMPFWRRRQRWNEE